MAAPKKKVDWEVVDSYLMAGCDGVEVAEAIGMHPDTLYAHCEADNKMGFSAYKQQKQAAGDALLKKTQFDVATKDKDRSMLIWLGKQRLGQTDKKDIDHTTKGESFNLKDLVGFKDG